MALNQGKIIKSLEQMVTEPHEEFIFSFLKAYGIPKATINSLKRGDGRRNVARNPGEIGIAHQLYFRHVRAGTDLDEAMDGILADPVISSFRIRFVLVTDYQSVVAMDRKVDDRTEFEFADFKSNYEFFLPLTGQYEKAVAYSEHPADIKACEKMGRLYDLIREANHYEPEELHVLNVFLTRLLFCFFAEDTGIFLKTNQMTAAIESMTQRDGSDVADFFKDLFAVLDLPDDDPTRKNYNVTLQAFPYVNGGLFKEHCHIPTFTTKSRRLLLECGQMKWADISPAIFGSMFQSVMLPKDRRALGAHYTSEKNIFKVIRPLFLDDLEEEFQSIADMKDGKAKAQRLKDFHNKIAGLGFLDPACGCGNFLIIAYRELRILEMKVLEALLALEHKESFLFIDASMASKVSISQFHGIELLEFPVEIAKVSMWLMEHVMNCQLAEKLGKTVASIPLKDSADIVCANALTNPWEIFANPDEINYIFGNPPFSGARTMSKENKKDLLLVFHDTKNAGNLDYVCCWYKIAIEYMKLNKNIISAFVSTNSIIQGEQVQVLWENSIKDGIVISFAYRTFKWDNEAKGNAGVHCVIIGFCFNNQRINRKIIKNDGNSVVVDNISPYLTSNPSVIVKSRTKPLSRVHEMRIGNMPIDNGYFLFTKDEKDAFLETEKDAYIYFRKWIGSKEFINGYERWCLYLGDCTEEQLEELPHCKRRVELVKEYRLSSKRPATQLLADTPNRFNVQNIQKHDYIIIPEVSSERRNYIPIGFLKPDVLASNLVKIVPNATVYDFSILTSAMHMAWMRAVCGRLESRYRYSRDLCYNTFPWPAATEAQQEAVSKLGQAVLDVREMYFDKTLAELYDPGKMPDDLRAAHHALDLAVDGLYRKKPFESEEERLEMLFDLYAKLVTERGDTGEPAYEEEEEEEDA